MQQPNYLREKATHGTLAMPVAIHHLSYLASDDAYFDVHWHEEVELLSVSSGALIYSVDGQDHLVKAGQGLFINSNRLHGARSYENMACEAIVVVFHPSIFDPSAYGPTYSQYIQPLLSGKMTPPLFLSRDLAWQATILDQLLLMDHHAHHPLEDWFLLLKSQLYSIWHYLYHHSQRPNEQVQPSSYKANRLKPVLTYIHEHYQDPLDLEQLSGMIPLSKGQFCKTFKELLGTTPIRYIVRYRLTQASDLLKTTDMKIGSIARSVGFDNISYFNREFIKMTGVSPKVYRRHRQATHPIGNP